jgi:alkaline phosphatase D
VLRRSFLHLLVSGALFALTLPGFRRAVAAAPYAFRHGISSGDPLHDGVIIWTRLSGARGESVPVAWVVAADVRLRTVVGSGETVTGPDRDYTVKVDVRGLRPGTRYYYRFFAGGAASEVGRTRTLPDGAPSSVSFAVVSCSNFAAGYFYAYREIARRDDLDAVLHLGDYIYEHGLGGYATGRAEQLGRVPEPAGELLTLADYRLRYAQYRADPDSRAMHAAHPLIAVWDDHEIANDAWRGGAQNHDEGEGEWEARRDAAVRAYVEWMPIRAEAAGAATRIYRAFRYGNLVALMMLDTRLCGRDRQPRLGTDMDDAEAARIIDDPGREMLGKVQRDWLRDRLGDSRGTTWQVVGQQVMVSPMRASDLEQVIDPDGPTSLPKELLDHSIALSKRDFPVLLDTWGGYGAARERLLADLEELADNAVVLSGDLHSAVAGNLVPRGKQKPVAVEFLATSVTSPSFTDMPTERRPGALRDATLARNPDLVYMESAHRGWLQVTFTPGGCVGEWYRLDSVHNDTYSVAVDKRLGVEAGRIGAGLHVP